MEHKRKKFTEFFNDLNPLTLLFALVIVVSLLTYIIPAGQFERVADETGRMMVVPGTYQTIEFNPATPVTVLMSFDLLPAAHRRLAGCDFFHRCD